MRKIFSMLICIFLLGMLAMPVSAATGAVFSQTANKTKVFKGEEVTVTVTVDITEPATSFGLTPIFDTSKFELVTGTCTPNSGTGWFLNGYFLVMLDTANPNTYSGSVGTYTLRALVDLPDVSVQLSGTPAVKNSTNVIDASVNPVTVTVSCEHTYGDWTGAENSHVHVCTKCGKSETVAHTWDSGNRIQESTCSDEGTIEYTCTVCNYTKQEALPATGEHKWGNWTVTKVATCAAEGSQTRTCSVCRETQIETIGKLTTHTWDQGKVTKTPTCEETGVKTYTCTVCGETKAEELSALGHDYDDGVVTKASTCTETGVKTYTCRNDQSHTKTETIPAAGHTPSEETVITKQPTCEETGLMSGVCAVCGVKLTDEVIPALGHDYELTSEMKPTCTEKGSKTYTCKNDLSHTYTENVDALGHTWSKWVENKETGKHERTCSVCKKIESAEHIWNSGMVTRPATCGEDGVKTYTCKGCGAVKTEVIPATGKHDYTASYKDNGDGTHTGICACGEENPNPEKHAYTINGDVIEEPTTSKEGKQEKLCVCGAKTEVTLPKKSANLDKVPKTGDITGQIVLGGASICAVLAAAFYLLRRKLAK